MLYVPRSRAARAKTNSRFVGTCVLSGLLLLAVNVLCADTPPLEFDPPEWDFGVISRDDGAVERPVAVRNNTEEEVRLSLLSTCACLIVEPDEIRLAAGEETAIRLVFDPEDEAGDIQKDVVVRTSLAEIGKALYAVQGTVAGGGTPGSAVRGAVAEESVSNEEEGADQALRIEYYYSPGCSSCIRFLNREIPRLQRELGIRLEVVEHSILDPEDYRRYRALLEELDAAERAYPALSAEGRLLQGEPEIAAELEHLLKALASAARREEPSERQTQPEPREPDKAPASETEARVEQRLAVVPVIAAGLLDGINPCAFTTLIFLISALVVAGRGRKDVLEIGLFFTLAVFLSYLGIGMGFFQAVRMASGFPIVAAVIKWVLFAVLVVFAGLSVYDYFLVRAGRAKEMLLQLPKSFRQRIHASIRTRTRALALISSSLVMGFLVSVFELACTGQVYFPTIVYMYRAGRRASAVVYLLIYNLGFIVPLLVVFLLTYLGVSSKAVTGFFQRSLRPVKIGLALLFVCLAVLTALT